MEEARKYAEKTVRNQGQEIKRKGVEIYRCKVYISQMQETYEPP
jgi:predicted peroxiredoxin